MRRAPRVIGSLLIGAGVLGLVWVVAVWRWKDPFTALYTTWQQHELQGQLDRIVARQQALRLSPGLAANEDRQARLMAERKWIASEAGAFQRNAHKGRRSGASSSRGSG